MTLRRVWHALALMAVVAVVVSNGSRGTHAQGTDDLARLESQVRELYNQGKYADAIPIAERYVALARRKHGENHTEYATAIGWLAYVYKAQGRYPEAEPLYKRALAIRQKALGAEHPDVAQSLNNLAELYDAQGRYPEAEPLYERALAIDETALAPSTPCSPPTSTTSPGSP